MVSGYKKSDNANDGAEPYEYPCKSRSRIYIAH